MFLLLIRHALAADRDAARWPDDADRPLLPKGRKAQRRMSRALLRAGLVPGRVLASPWTRAWQTARVLCRETGLPKTAREPCEALAAPPDLDALAAAVGEPGPDEVIAVVGHEPWLAELAALLLTGREDGLAIDFPKSGVLGLAAERLAERAGTLRLFWRDGKAP